MDRSSITGSGTASRGTRTGTESPSPSASIRDWTRSNSGTRPIPATRPRRFLPAPRDDRIDWSRPDERERAARIAARQIDETLLWALELQTDPWLSDTGRGFFLVFLCSFNEWHEGHQFEPMKDAADLTPGERAVGYHNPEDGAYRLRRLADRLARVV